MDVVLTWCGSDIAAARASVSEVSGDFLFDVFLKLSYPLKKTGSSIFIQLEFLSGLNLYLYFDVSLGGRD